MRGECSLSKVSVQCWPVQANAVVAEIRRLFPSVCVQRVEPEDRSVVNFNFSQHHMDVDHLTALSQLVLSGKAITYDIGEDAY